MYRTGNRRRAWQADDGRQQCLGKVGVDCGRHRRNQTAMLSLRNLGCSRAASRSSFRGVLRPGTRLASRSRLPASCCGGLRAEAAAGRSASAGHLFSLAKPPEASQRLICQEVSFSAMAMGQSQKTHQVTAARLPLGGEWFVSDYLAGAVRSFREAMVKDRRPFAFLGWRFRTNVSNMCGHASFGVLALAYLETDVLALR